MKHPFGALLNGCRVYLDWFGQDFLGRGKKFLGAVLLVPAVWVLCFGNLGFEPLGIEGCAYSLLLVTGLKTVFLFSLAFQTEFRGIRFVRHIKSAGENDFLTIIRVGAPLGLSEASLISFGAVILC